MVREEQAHEMCGFAQAPRKIVRSRPKAVARGRLAAASSCQTTSCHRFRPAAHDLSRRLREAAHLVGLLFSYHWGFPSECENARTVEHLSGTAVPGKSHSCLLY